VRVVLHADATAELTDAGDRYEASRAGLGRDFVAEVDRSLDLIGTHPVTWPRWPDAPPDAAIRRFLLSRFPYGLAYVVRADQVVVLAVAHLHREPLYWLRRANE